jgi:hypothetical protein
MYAPFADVCCARVPLEQVAALASLRALPDVLLFVDAEHAWVRWESGDERPLRALVPLAGAILYARRHSGWHPMGQRLPAFGVPSGAKYRPVHDILFPAPVQPLAPPRDPPPWRQTRIALVPEGQAHATTGLIAPLAEVAVWVDAIPTARLRSLRAAICLRQVLLLGACVPLLPTGERFWGTRVLRPLGFRVEPAVPESALCEALHLAEDDILVLRSSTTEVVAHSAIKPLTRAGLRQAAEEDAA